MPSLSRSSRSDVPPPSALLRRLGWPRVCIISTKHSVYQVQGQVTVHVLTRGGDFFLPFFFLVVVCLEPVTAGDGLQGDRQEEGAEMCYIHVNK